MNTIHITHNPFTVDTHFLINGEQPAEGCKLSSYKESRLQRWIEDLFDELSNLFNGENQYQVTFRGVESDFLDIQSAAGVAEKQGMRIELHWEKTKPTEQRLEQIWELVKGAEENPKFQQYIDENDEVRGSIKEAFNRDFDVYVVATMSSGKSTLINAMLGHNLLPAANEATTATIARIIDNDGMSNRFSAKSFSHKGKLLEQHEDVNAELLTKWNLQSDISHIDIEGNIQAIKERKDVRLVLTDTPGPNNSQNEEHQRTTMGYIQDSTRNPLILYVLNASQLGTNDDRNLLSLVAEEINKVGKQNKDRFIFVVNKMDVFDPENGEDIESVLQRVRQYLIENGIKNPLLYPVSANLTRLIRTPGDYHTRKERGDFSTMADLFGEVPSMDLMQYMPITPLVHRVLKEKDYSELLKKSGLPAVEAMIDEYIDKYNLPHRLKRVYDAMNRATKAGLDEVSLIEQLEQDESTLAKINEELAELDKRREKGFDTNAYMAKIEREGKVLPRETEEELTIIEAALEPVLRKLNSSFSKNEVKVSTAEKKIQDAENLLQFHHKKLINQYERVFASSQELIREDLKNEYKRYVEDIFSNTQSLALPVLDGIKRVISNISFNLEVKQSDIQKKNVITDSEEVSDSSWYNPFSWGRTKTVYTYGTEEYVNLKELWNERLVRVDTEFSGLLSSARTEIESGKDRLIKQYIAFMTREFETKFAELAESLKEKSNDREIREKAIKEAKEMHTWIINFKSKLDGILTIEEAL